MESALTLPLTIFLILGILQLFMMLQARIMAEYGIYQAVRAGSLNNGDCRPMMHAAIMAFLPTIVATDTPSKLESAFNGKRSQNKYDIKFDGAKYNGSIVWMDRRSPQPGQFVGREDDQFDQPSNNPRTLSVRAIFWYHLKIPFAAWVMGRMFLAEMGIKKYTAQNPLMETQKAKWKATAEGKATISALAGGTWPASPRTEMKKNISKNIFVVPIEVSGAMRMMTPAMNDALKMKCPGFTSG